MGFRLCFIKLNAIGCNSARLVINGQLISDSFGEERTCWDFIQFNQSVIDDFMDNSSCPSDRILNENISAKATLGKAFFIANAVESNILLSTTELSIAPLVAWQKRGQCHKSVA